MQAGRQAVNNLGIQATIQYSNSQCNAIITTTSLYSTQLNSIPH